MFERRWRCAMLSSVSTRAQGSTKRHDDADRGISSQQPSPLIDEQTIDLRRTDHRSPIQRAMLLRLLRSEPDQASATLVASRSSAGSTPAPQPYRRARAACRETHLSVSAHWQRLAYRTCGEDHHALDQAPSGNWRAYPHRAPRQHAQRVQIRHGDLACIRDVDVGTAGPRIDLEFQCAPASEYHPTFA